MRELSLNVLDIAQNSIAAGASLIEIAVERDDAAHTLRLTVADNGRGMTQEQARQVRDPFYTTRTTRKVGMGIPLFELAAKQSGGGLTIESAVGEGTRVTALFHTDHVDFVPLGDIGDTMVTLIRMNPDRDFLYRHSVDGNGFVLDTRELKTLLDGVPLDEPSIAQWLRDYLKEQIQQTCGGATI